jgi:hypothetical protein
MQTSSNISYDRNRKRPYENSHDQQDSEAKRQNTKYFLRICVNTKSTGFIIGKAGKNIEMFRVLMLCYLLFIVSIWSRCVHSKRLGAIPWHSREFYYFKWSHGRFAWGIE